MIKRARFCDLGMASESAAIQKPLVGHRFPTERTLNFLVVDNSLDDLVKVLYRSFGYCANSLSAVPLTQHRPLATQNLGCIIKLR